jgi:NAD(P)-dependent dehydrogenase (short-subunit alcohol dehydrogenase family)
MAASVMAVPPESAAAPWRSGQALSPAAAPAHDPDEPGDSMPKTTYAQRKLHASPAPADLAERIAIVTGGTQGLGETVARLFAARGAGGLVITGRNAERGKAVAVALTNGGCRTLFVRADLQKVADCRKVVAAAEKGFGRVDVLVNAGASTDRGGITDTTPELYDYIMDVNVKGPFFLMQEAVRVMRREKRGGSIINILSMSAHGGQPFLTPYSVSKGALLTLTKNAAYALMKERIRVNGLTIGWMDTPGENAIGMKAHGRKDGWIREAEKAQPLGRLLNPDEVARACAWLASDESGLTSGAIIDMAQMVLGAHD